MKVSVETPVLSEAPAPAEGRAVTVCICTHERTHYLRSCLDSLRRQTVGVDGFSIVVVDSASSPEASTEIARLVATVPNATMVRVDTLGISLARNAGARAATGDYVAYIDDDAQAAGTGSSRSCRWWPMPRRGRRCSAAGPCPSGRRRCRPGGRTSCSAC